MYATSAQKRPERLTGGGRGIFCGVPKCKSASYNRHGQLSKIGFFTLPNDAVLSQKWFDAIQDCDSSFVPRRSISVCEFHFKDKEIKVSLGIGRKKLIPGSIPSLFDDYNISVPSDKRPEVKEGRHTFRTPEILQFNIAPSMVNGNEAAKSLKRRYEIQASSLKIEPLEVKNKMHVFEKKMMIQPSDRDTCTRCVQHRAEIEQLKKKVLLLEMENKRLKALGDLNEDRVIYYECAFSSNGLLDVPPPPDPKNSY